MKITHIIVGHEASKPLIEAMQINANLQGDIIILRDTLGIGNIYTNEEVTFEVCRTDFWKIIQPNWDEKETVDDEQKIKYLLNNLDEQHQVWLWVAPCVSDVMAYYWVINYFKNLPNILLTIFINNLPFFNAKGILFYPKNFSEVLPTEFIKCQKLLKEVSLADFEIDIDEWEKLCGENAMIRSYEGGKKITSRNENFYDSTILNQFQFNNDFVKANKVIQQALSKITDTVSDVFLIFRLKQLIVDNKLETQGDTTKQLKDFEVRIFK